MYRDWRVDVFRHIAAMQEEGFPERGVTHGYDDEEAVELSRAIDINGDDTVLCVAMLMPITMYEESVGEAEPPDNVAQLVQEDAESLFNFEVTGQVRPEDLYYIFGVLVANKNEIKPDLRVVMDWSDNYLEVDGGLLFGQGFVFVPFGRIARNVETHDVIAVTDISFYQSAAKQLNLPKRGQAFDGVTEDVYEEVLGMQEEIYRQAYGSVSE